MAFGKKKRTVETVQTVEQTEQTKQTEFEPIVYQGDPSLPGIAGYQGPNSIPKNAMPISRFKYVRPDQRRAKKR